MKGNNDGIQNEKQIVEVINEKQVKSLDSNPKKFISEMFPNSKDEAIVKANKIGGQGYKPDVEIQVDNTSHWVSIKKGSGNSVHQEKIDYFIHYCMTVLGMTEKEKESLLLFLYGDGTTNGDSLPEERLKDKDLLDTYKKEIQIIQDFLNRNKRNLLERFLVYGRLGRERNIKADYLYHGDAEEGVWCPLDFDALDYLSAAPNSVGAPLSIGPLTIQTWNRNLEGKAELEKRRHSIQVKWGACKSYVKKINELHLIKQKDMTDTLRLKNNRLAGDNRQGFINQENLIDLIDGHRVADLSFAIKNIVSELFPGAASSDIVKAYKITENDVKPRIAIELNNVKKNLTVFMGNGNSVHQEKLEGFLEYCRNELNISEKEESAFLTIMYGDGTLNGNSEAKDRLKNTSEVKEKYSKEIEIVQNFIDKNKEKLIERFLIYGKGGRRKNIKADYIYYGTDVTGRLVPFPVVLEYIKKMDNSDNALLSIGSLTIQPWNRNPDGKPNLEKRRHSLQVKWGRMKYDLAQICNEMAQGNKGTKDGDWEEYELVSKLNRDKSKTNRLWNIICEKLKIDDLEDIHAVRVTNMVYSKLSERVVLPKTDVYLVKGKISHQTLLDNNFWLDEDVIEDLHVEPIEKSGISCKRPNSKNFTYSKLSINTFNALFNNPLMGAGICLFINEKDAGLNKNIVNAWSVSEEDILNAFNDEIIAAGELLDISNVNTAKVIKESSIEFITSMIKNDPKINDAIFWGKGIFAEPYAANYIYTDGKLSDVIVPKFSITTGSGRHKGIYTIIIKP